MGKSKMFCLKLPEDIFKQISVDIIQSNLKRKGFPPMTKTSWIQDAIQSKLNKTKK